ncbi:MAG: DUF1707 domain-containing protein [Solirubrobacteraceae bacterium]
MRASDADREKVVVRLRRAADEGRLHVEEFDERLGRVLSARTYGQLDATVSDLPSRRALIKRPARIRAGVLRLVRHARRAGIVLRSPRRTLIAGALATVAVAVPLTVTEVGTSRPTFRTSQAGARPRPMPPSLLYDLREENNPNAPHPPVYYVMREIVGK